MFEYRVLITSVGGPFGSKNLQFMKKSIPGKVWVLGVDQKHNDLALQIGDKFITVPRGDSKNYLDKIIKIVREERINFVLPCSDEEALSLVNGKEIIESYGARLLCTEKKSISIMSDKIKTYRFLKNKMISVPEFFVINNYQELEQKSKYFYDKYKAFVLKDPSSRGNRGILVVDKINTNEYHFNSSRELHTSFKLFKNKIKLKSLGTFPKLLSEKLFEPAYDVDVLAKCGQIIHAIPRERINPAGVPFKGNIIRQDNRLINLAISVAKELNLSYLYDLDIMTRKNGDPVVCEINPRPSGSIAVSIKSGAPIYKHLLEFDKIKTFPKPFIPVDGTKVLPMLECFINN